MKCPQCSKQLVSLSESCPSCSYIFGKEAYERCSCYFGIKGDIEQVQSIVKDEVWTRLKNVSKRLDQLEGLFNDDLVRRSSGIQPPEIQHPLSKPVSDNVGIADEKASAVSPKKTVDIPPADRPAAIKHGVLNKPVSVEFEMNLGQKGLLIVGIVTMIFGIGYFLKYSFEQGWVGPAGRVAMAYLWGIVMLGAGNIFRKRHMEIFGLYLIGGGIATLYASTYAGFQLYHLFGQFPSFSIMVMITMLACILSIVYDTRWLAVLGMIGGFLTPILLSTGQDNQIALMTYITILNLGLLGVAFYKKWDLLNVLGFVFTYLLYTAWHLNHYSVQKFWPAIIFLNIFYLIYSLMPFAYQFARSVQQQFRGFLIMVPNSFIAFGFSYGMIKEYAGLEWVSLISVLYAIVFLSMATYLAKAGKQDEEAFTVLLANAALFLIITIPIIVSKHWITIFWALQAATLLWMRRRLDRKNLTGIAYLLLAVSIGKFLRLDYPEVFRLRFDEAYIFGSYTYLIIERIVTSLVLLLTTAWFAVVAHRDQITVITKNGSDARFISVICGGLLFIILNVETAAFFHDYLPAARFAAISVLWAVWSIAMVVVGFRQKSAALRKVSLGLFAITLVKVFLFDMTNISTPYRIVSFIILGLMLVGTSYLYYRFRGNLEDFQSGNQQKEA